MSKVGFVNSDIDSARRAGQLGGGVDYTAVVFSVGMCGKDEQAVGEFVEYAWVDFCLLDGICIRDRPFKTRYRSGNRIDKLVDLFFLARSEG